MTDRQVDALRLADALNQQAVWEGHYGPSYLRDLLPEAADELRRLHAENEALRDGKAFHEGACDAALMENRALRQANEAFAQRQEWWNERMFALEKQRDELLEALKGIIKAEHSEGRGGSGFIPKAPTLEHQQRVYQAWQKAHAAIAKVKGEKQ